MHGACNLANRHHLVVVAPLGKVRKPYCCCAVGSQLSHLLRSCASEQPVQCVCQNLACSLSINLSVKWARMIRINSIMDPVAGET